MDLDEDDLLNDSIRKSQQAHRKPDAAAAIAARIAEERNRKFEDAVPLEAEPDGVLVPPGKTMVIRTPRSYEDALPLSAKRAARLGLTSILPDIKVKREAKFRRFIEALADPDLKANYPTYRSLAEHFEVSIQTIKTWLLSEEAARSVRASVHHEAMLAMPAVIRSVRLRAELTGDPHAAEFIRKVAKLGTAETDQAASFEKTLRQIAMSRKETSLQATRLQQANSKGAEDPVIIDVAPEKAPVSNENS